MNRTRISDLFGVLAVVGTVVYLLLRFSYERIPAMGWFTPVPFAGLAVLEWVLARRVRAVIAHDPDAKPMTAIAIARFVALGKASALVGAGVTGAALGLLVHVLPDIGRVSIARSDAIIAVLLAASAASLVAAGLALERAGIAPTDGLRTRNIANG